MLAHQGQPEIVAAYVNWYLTNEMTDNGNSLI